MAVFTGSRRFKVYLILGLVIALFTGCGGQKGVDSGASSGNSGQGADTQVLSGNTMQKNDTNASSGNTGQKEGDGSTSSGNTEKSETPDQDIFGRVSEKTRKKQGVYYEIFVRSFADSDGDGIGDFNGLTACLDYLNDADSNTNTDLEVDGLYLMPIQTATSYHGYDVTDYYAIDPEYGTMEDFEHFLDEAHKRNLHVILDFVVNHTGREHPWFRESSKSQDNLFRDYYCWADETTQGIDVKSVLSSGTRLWHPYNGSYYYGYFWDGMPDLNYDNPEVREEIKKAAAFWLEKGVDGFRLDAAMHIYSVNEKPVGTRMSEKNHSWWKEFRESVETANPNVYLVGEVWEKAYVSAPYYQAFDSLFNFDAGEAIINTILSESGMAVSGKGFASWLLEKYQTFAKTNPGFIDAPFLTNHDQNRIMDRLKGDTDKAKMAAAILLTLPGNPYIYYGEEIGMRGSKPDEKIRVPFIWFEKSKPPQCTWESTLNNFNTVPVESQQTDPDSLLSFYKTLIRVRHSSKALMWGGFKPVDSGNRAVVAYSRSYADDGEKTEEVIVFHNVSSQTQQVTLDENLKGAELLFDSQQDEQTRDGIQTDPIMEISPRSTVILKINPGD